MQELVAIIKRQIDLSEKILSNSTENIHHFSVISHERVSGNFARLQGTAPRMRGERAFSNALAMRAEFPPVRTGQRLDPGSPHDPVAMR
jgi:hypothetical protein